VAWLCQSLIAHATVAPCRQHASVPLQVQFTKSPPSGCLQVPAHVLHPDGRVCGVCHGHPLPAVRLRRQRADRCASYLALAPNPRSLMLRHTREFNQTRSLKRLAVLLSAAVRHRRRRHRLLCRLRRHRRRHRRQHRRRRRRHMQSTRSTPWTTCPTTRRRRGCR
jgi:hypothetical protein